MTDDNTPLACFLDLSAALTGYTAVDLQGTGLAEDYYNWLAEVLGERICGELWSTWQALAASCDGDEACLRAGIKTTILEDAKFGPPARNIITMWYLGNWDQLPQAWRNAYGANAADVSRVISARAYVEGLVWPTIGAHPMAAKQPGFGTWSLPPKRDTA
jgi:hypothetical protein